MNSGKKKILIVDDDANLLAMLGDFLEGEGYDVEKAQSAESALAMLRTLKPNLVVLDMMMPGMGGKGFLDRTARPDGSFKYPVLVLTAKAAMAEYFADKQVDGFLAKPCSPDDLSLEVSRIIFQSGSREKAAPHPLVYLADPVAVRRGNISSAITLDGCSVEAFASGAELVEALVTSPPSAVAMPLDLGDQGADVVVGLVKGMAATASVKVVVYGVGLADVSLDKVVALDSRRCKIVPGDNAKEVSLAVGELLFP